jgi:nucleoside-diphosphate-sugar epimerase
MNWPKILVTGAAGFIGGWVVDGLYRAGAADIRAGIARDWHRERLAQMPVEIVHCDVTNEKSLDAAMKDVAVIVHCAHSRFDEGLIASGTKRLLGRSAANGVRTVIHMSSAAIYGDAFGIVEEGTLPMAPINSYGVQKRIAEQFCEAAAGPRLTVAVLRPTLVYGPKSERWTTLYIKRILAGELRELGRDGEGNANLLYIDDLVRFVAHLAITQLPEYSVFNVNGAEVPTFNQYFDCLRSALQCESVHIPAASSGIRAALRRPIGDFGKYLSKRHPNLLDAARRSPRIAQLIERAEGNLRLRPNEGELRLYAKNVIYSTSSAKELGFEAKVSLADGVAASVAWANDTGLMG